MESPPPSSPSDLVDVYAFAEALDVDPSTVRTWVQRYGVEKRGREGRRSLYSLADLYGAERTARETHPARP